MKNIYFCFFPVSDGKIRINQRVTPNHSITESKLYNSIKTNQFMEALPRKGSIVYTMIFGDKKAREKTLKRWKFINRFLIVPFYRLRILQLIGFKHTFIIIQTKGRKSGKIRRSGVNLRKLGDRYYIFLARGKNTLWFRNHLANPDETRILYGLRWKPVTMYPISPEVKIDVMREYIKNYPKWARLGIGWRKTDDLYGDDLIDYIKKIEIAEFNFPDDN